VRFSGFKEAFGITLRIGLPVAVVLTCALVALTYVKPLAPVLSHLEDKLIDYRMEQAWDRERAEYPAIAVVTIDNEDLAQYQSAVPIPRDFLARIIDALDALAPRVIGLDLFFIHPQTPERDDKFRAAVRGAKVPVVLGAAQLENLGGADDAATEKMLAFQRSFIMSTGQRAGLLSLAYDADSVVRVVHTSAPGAWPGESLDAVIAKIAGVENIPPMFRIAWLRGSEGQRDVFRVITARELLDAHAEQGAAWTALRQKLKDRIVLVGIALTHMDRHHTPLGVITRSPDSGTLIHAHILAQLLDGRYFSNASPLLLFGLLVSRSLLGFFAGVRSRSYLALSLALVGGAVGLFLLDARMLDVSRVVIPITLLILAWALAFLAAFFLSRRRAVLATGRASAAKGASGHARGSGCQ
jgi:adenylate cyclase